MPKTVGGRRKHICNARVGGAVVAVVVVNGTGSQQCREEFVVGDRLQLGRDNRPRLLEDLFIGERRIFLGDLFGLLIMLPDPQCVHRGQGRVLVGADIACQEQRTAGTARVFEAGFVKGQQISCTHFQKSVLERP